MQRSECRPHQWAKTEHCVPAGSGVLRLCGRPDRAKTCDSTDDRLRWNDRSMKWSSQNMR